MLQGYGDTMLRAETLEKELEDHVWFEDRWMVASLCDE
jgi:hypothetical protein